MNTEDDEFARIAREQALNKMADNARELGLDYEPAQQEPVGDEWTPCMKLPVVVHVRKQRPGEAHVSTREGITPVKPDDLIMRGISGEEYPIGRSIFEQTYSLDTAQPQRKPLMDEQIDAIWDAAITPSNHIRVFVRAIEAAHGIKENT